MTAATSVLGSRASPRRFALPGFGLTMGFTLAYLSLIVLIPLAGVFFKPVARGWEGIEHTLTSPRVLEALKLSFGTAFIAALINAVFGLLVAWVFVRYEFSGKRLFDAMIDLPFALPTAVAGIALTALYSGSGWIGQFLEPLADRVVVMNRGRIEQVGTTDQVYEQPASPFVFDFLGSVNVIEAEVRGRQVFLPGGELPIVTDSIHPSGPASRRDRRVGHHRCARPFGAAHRAYCTRCRHDCCWRRAAHR